MIKENLKEYADENWEDYIRKVSEIAGKMKESFEDCENQMYSFDDIVSDMFYNEESKKPTSADGVFFVKNTVCLNEFKTGFYDKVDIHNLDPSKMKCDKTGKECLDYLKIFVKNRKNEKENLKKSILMKAIESYVTLEKKVFFKCPTSESSKFRIVFNVIIDAEPVNAHEDMLASVANKKAPKGNEIEDLRKLLKRMNVNKDASGNDYYYDEIKVFSISSFIQYLKKQVTD